MATPNPRSGAVAAARRKQPPWLWIGLGAIVVVLAVIAVASTGGGEDKKETAAGVEQTRPVTVTGAPLPEYSDGADPALGKTIPEVRGQSFDGSPVDIRNDGRPKLILFVAHWCPHCQREVPILAKFLKANSLPKGVDLYTVSTGVSPPRGNYPPSKWLDQEGWPARTLADSKDGEAGNAFGLASFPYFVAVDGSGKVVARTSGEISTDDFAGLALAALGNR